MKTCQRLPISSQSAISSVQSLCRIWLFTTPWTATHQASLPITKCWSLLKLRPIASVMPSNHLILCRPFSSCLQSFSASGSFLRNQFFPSGGQSIWSFSFRYGQQVWTIFMTVFFGQSAINSHKHCPYLLQELYHVPELRRPLSNTGQLK